MYVDSIILISYLCRSCIDILETYKVDLPDQRL